jgi:hypothetical protein
VASTATALAAGRASHTASLLAFEHAHPRAYKNTVTWQFSRIDVSPVLFLSVLAISGDATVQADRDDREPGEGSEDRHVERQHDGAGVRPGLCLHLE